MNLSYFITVLFLAHSCNAGPLVVLAGMAADAITESAAIAAGATEEAAAYAGELAAWDFYGTTSAELFGVGVRDAFYGEYLIVNGALFWGSTVGVTGTLAAEGGAIAAGTYVAVTNKKQSQSVMASIHSEQSAYSVSGSMTEGALRSSLASQTAAMTHHTEYDPFTFVSGSVFSRTIPTVSKAPAVTTIPPPPGTPVMSLPLAQRPSEVPPGVPEYNFRMCQYDIIKMRDANETLLFDIPKGTQNVRVDNIPPTCMVLSNMLVGNPALGPHPIVMGSASLQWNNASQDGINLVRQAFGLPLLNATSPAQSSSPAPAKAPALASKSGGK